MTGWGWAILFCLMVSVAAHNSIPRWSTRRERIIVRAGAWVFLLFAVWCLLVKLPQRWG
jgi:threonine/homoserine/homoserine lactone efflux protein